MTCRLKKPCGEKKKKKEELLLLHDVVVRKTGLLVLISLRWTRAAPWAQDLRCSGSSYEQAVGRQQSSAGCEQEGGLETFLLGFTMIESKGEKKKRHIWLHFYRPCTFRLSRSKGGRQVCWGKKELLAQFCLLRHVLPPCLEMPCSYGWETFQKISQIILGYFYGELLTSRNSGFQKALQLLPS